MNEQDIAEQAFKNGYSAGYVAGRRSVGMKSKLICPKCGFDVIGGKMNKEKLGKGVKFERIRRITGYLVGTLDKWNDAKKAEERDRVKHGFGKNEK